MLPYTNSSLLSTKDFTHVTSRAILGYLGELSVWGPHDGGRSIPWYGGDARFHGSPRLLLQSPFSFCRWKENFLLLLRPSLLPRAFLWLKDKIKLTLNHDCLACIGPWVRSPTPIQTNPKPNWHPFIYFSIKIKSLCFLCTEPSLSPWESRGHNKSYMQTYL